MLADINPLQLTKSQKYEDILAPEEDSPPIIGKIIDSFC